MYPVCICYVPRMITYYIIQTKIENKNVLESWSTGQCDHQCIRLSSTLVIDDRSYPILTHWPVSWSADYDIFRQNTRNWPTFEMYQSFGTPLHLSYIYHQDTKMAHPCNNHDNRWVIFLCISGKSLCTNRIALLVGSVSSTTSLFRVNNRL